MRGFLRKEGPSRPDNNPSHRRARRGTAMAQVWQSSPSRARSEHRVENYSLRPTQKTFGGSGEESGAAVRVRARVQADRKEGRSPGGPARTDLNRLREEAGARKPLLAPA